MAKSDRDFKTTAEIKVSSRIVDQVIGQEDAVNVIKKASMQRRHVLLIGEPGTGKSMLGLALAELLPKEKLVDVLAFPNPNDENQPLVRVVPAGQGRALVNNARMQGDSFFKNQNIIMFALVILAMIAPWWVLSHYKAEFGLTGASIMFAAFFLGGMIFLAAFIMFLNFGKKLGERASIPKLIVDNFKKKQVPFLDATGAHAGALLGDVLHDPFQTFSYNSILNCISNNGERKVEIKTKIDLLFDKHKKDILQKKGKNYEAVFLPKDELLVLGEINNSVSPVEVLSANRYDHDDKMIKFTTSDNKELIVTPEHKIAVWKNGKIVYVEAKDIKADNEIVANAEDIIIDEQDIINTYTKEQQELAESYYSYMELKNRNSSFGYKRIATKLGVSYGRTRWWWEKNSAPVPVQTVEHLKQKGLLPLRIDNPKLPLIAKAVGATFGDGGIFKNLNGIFLSSSEKEAVEEFGRDLENIFGIKDKENSRIIEGGVYGHSWCYQNTNRDIIRFFLALGAPKGNKTKLALRVPSWILLKPDFEDEFYGSLLGGELGTPIIHKHGNYLTTLEVGITGLPKFKENRIEFLTGLAKYLNKRRINTTSIYEGKSKTEGSFVFRLLIEKKLDNVLLFMMNVKINYCRYKVERLYGAIGKWAKLKKNKYEELIGRGYGAEHAMKILNLTPNSLYLLLNNFGPQTEAAL